MFIIQENKLLVLGERTMGGPCLLPPTHYSAYDTPYTTGNIVAKSCLQETAEDGSCVVAMGRECYCNENNV